MRRYPADGKRAADLIVQDLATGTRMTFGNVGEFAWSDARALLAFTVDVDGGVGNAVQLYDASTGTVRVLDSSPSLYRMLAWREKSEDLAVLRSTTDKEFRDTTHVVLAWTRVAAPNAVRTELDPAQAPSGFPSALRVAEHRRPEWAKDGSIVYVGLRPRERVAPRTDSTAAASGNGNGGGERTEPIPHSLAFEDDDKPSDVQVWHAKDVRIMPMQKVQEQQDLQRTLLTAWHLADGHVVQIGTDLLETARVLRGDRFATETDRKPYAFGAKFGRPYSDVYVVDVKTGDATQGAREGALLLRRQRDRPQARLVRRQGLLDAGRRDGRANEPDGEGVRRVQPTPTTTIPTDMMPPADFQGWAKDDRAVLVADEYDLWSLNPDGSGGTRLTNGAADKVVHRYARTSRRDDDGIDLANPVYLSLFGKRTKQSGYGRLAPGTVERLVLDDASLNRLTRADSTDTFAFTRERYDDSPDWFAGARRPARRTRQVSATNPFQKDYAWGDAELVNYRTVAGHDLQGVLLYPANYDASKKYPMIVYPYELLSQTLHQYIVPHGAQLLRPDGLDARTDTSCSSRTSCSAVATRASPCSRRCEPAVRSVTSRGLVDSDEGRSRRTLVGRLRGDVRPDAHQHVRRRGRRRADHELPELRRRHPLDARASRSSITGRRDRRGWTCRSGRTWRRTCAIHRRRR